MLADGVSCAARVLGADTILDAATLAGAQGVATGDLHAAVVSNDDDVENAQSSCAAIFVHWHLDGTKARWGHVDLAFPAMRNDRGPGFGVALLADAVCRLGGK